MFICSGVSEHYGVCQAHTHKHTHTHTHTHTYTHAHTHTHTHTHTIFTIKCGLLKTVCFGIPCAMYLCYGPCEFLGGFKKKKSVWHVFIAGVCVTLCICFVESAWWCGCFTESGWRFEHLFCGIGMIRCVSVLRSRDVVYLSYGAGLTLCNCLWSRRDVYLFYEVDVTLRIFPWSWRNLVHLFREIDVIRSRRVLCIYLFFSSFFNLIS